MKHGDPGEVVLFHGDQATQPGFWPTEDQPNGRFVQGGDLVVFDEWRLYFPRRGALPTRELEPFLRWHRHLVDQNGVACDVAIGTQLLSDIHTDFRGLVERSYKFVKLKALGLKSAFAWHAYEGHLQPKGESYTKGNGRYKKEIFDLYSSYDASNGDGNELSTDKRTSLWGKSVYLTAGGVIAALAGGTFGVLHFLSGPEVEPPPIAPAGVQRQAMAAPQPPKSPFRIVGQIGTDEGTRVIVTDDKGATRVLLPGAFTFEGGRPVRGLVDGSTVIAEDRVVVVAEVPVL